RCGRPAPRSAGDRALGDRGFAAGAAAAGAGGSAAAAAAATAAVPRAADAPAHAAVGSGARVAPATAVLVAVALPERGLDDREVGLIAARRPEAAERGGRRGAHVGGRSVIEEGFAGRRERRGATARAVASERAAAGGADRRV